MLKVFFFPQDHRTFIAGNSRNCFAGVEQEARSRAGPRPDAVALVR